MKHNSAPQSVQQKLAQLHASPCVEARIQTVEKNFHTALKRFAQAILLIATAVSQKNLSRLEKKLVGASELLNTLQSNT